MPAGLILLSYLPFLSLLLQLHEIRTYYFTASWVKKKLYFLIFNHKTLALAKSAV